MIDTLHWVGGLDGYADILDQTLLPTEEKRLTLRSVEEMHTAIGQLAVRGAPAIGVAGAFGMVLALRKVTDSSIHTDLAIHKAYLDSSRPTAVNLSWATREIIEGVRGISDPLRARQRVLDRALEIYQDDRDRCARIGAHGSSLVTEGGCYLTHCNAGALATAGMGTALSVFYVAKKEGRTFSVFADETRPLLQGGRLTAWELCKAGIDVTVICDNMAAFLMSRRRIDAVFVGADRIARNGDTANKIGTYSLALSAKHHGVPFYVAAPWSTFDVGILTGCDIPIEERNSTEIREMGSRTLIPENAKVWNPAFDVTPAALISAFITENGLIRVDQGLDLIQQRP